MPPWESSKDGVSVCALDSQHLQSHGDSETGMRVNLFLHQMGVSPRHVPMSLNGTSCPKSLMLVFKKSTHGYRNVVSSLGNGNMSFTPQNSCKKKQGVVLEPL